MVNWPCESVAVVYPRGWSSTRAPTNGSWFTSVARPVIVPRRSCEVMRAGKIRTKKTNSETAEPENLQILKMPPLDSSQSHAHTHQVQSTHGQGRYSL